MSRDRSWTGSANGRTELENHYIDELVSGNLSRRDFLRRGSMIGMSAPLLGAILAACGSSSKIDVGASSGTRGTSSAPVDQGRDAADRVRHARRGSQSADDLRRRRSDSCSTRPASS